MKVFNGNLSYPGRVVRFRDGDTAQIEMNIGFDVIICRGFRFVGIESWELASAEREKAAEAARALTAQFGGRECVCYPSTRGFDCYGRLRGLMTIDGEDVAGLIIKLGLAWAEKRSERATAKRG